MISPSALSDFAGRPPFAVFMRRELWSDAGADLIARYPQGYVKDVVPDGSRVVLEVPA